MPPGAVIPPAAVDAVVGADGEQVEVIGVAGHDVHGRTGTALQAADREPGRPAGRSVPPGAVDAVVGADGEYVEVPGVAGDGRHRRAVPAGRGDAAGELKPAGPAAALIPPVGHGAAVARHREHVQVLWVAGDHADWRGGPGGQGGERTDPVPDHLAAYVAEGHAQVAHLAVVLGPEPAAMVVMRPLEQA